MSTNEDIPTDEDAAARATARTLFGRNDPDAGQDETTTSTDGNFVPREGTLTAVSRDEEGDFIRALFGYDPA